MDQIDQIIRIIKISPEDRQPEDINILIQLTKEIQFFKYYIEQGKSEIHKKCCKCMVLEQHPQKNVVFNIGTKKLISNKKYLRILMITQFGNQQMKFIFVNKKGTKFYIILEGEVGVYIKNKKAAPVIDFEKLMQMKPRNKIQKVARILKDQNYKLETESCLIKETNTISSIFEQAFKKQVQKFRQQSLQLNRFNTQEGDFSLVSTLKAGSSFGELALINDRPRLATIVCSLNCKFAVIDKENFQRILKEQEEIKLIKALNLYSSIPLFEGFSTYLLKQVHWSSFRVKYKMNEKVFAQGDESDAMYIVYSGSFLVFQKFDQSKKTALEEEELENLNAEQFFNNYKIRTKGKKNPIQNTCNYIEGTDIKICQLLPYQLLGEEDLFDNTHRSYNVICTSLEGELIRIKNKEFKQRILNDVSAHQYLIKNVPLKKKQFADKILHQKTILLNNLAFISQKQQAQSLQSKLQNGKIEEATFFNQKLVVPSSQVIKQNCFVLPASNNSSKRESEKINIPQQSPTKTIPTLPSQQYSKEVVDDLNTITITDTSTTHQRKSGIVDNTMLGKSDSSMHEDQLTTLQLNTNTNGKISSVSNRPMSSVKEKEHTALRDYFFNVGDPLLRSCFQEEFNVLKQNSTQSTKKEQVIQAIFQPSSKSNPKNHQYHPSAKIHTQPIKEDYVHVNGNIRQVLKYRNPTENTADFILKSNPSERLPTEPPKSNRTITFIPTNIDQSSPVSLSNKRGIKTMHDLGPADLVGKIESTPQGIRSSRMGKMKNMIKALGNKSQHGIPSSSVLNQPIQLSNPQSSLIKYKAISVSSITHIPYQNNYSLSQSHMRYTNYQDSINETNAPKTRNQMSCQSIASLKDIGNYNSSLEMQLKQAKLLGDSMKQYSSSSQNNLFSSYGGEPEDNQTDRSKNSILIKSGQQQSPFKLGVARRHTDRVSTSSQQLQKKPNSKQNMIIEENTDYPPSKSIINPFSTQNQNAHKIINEGALILKELIKGTNSARQLSNKNYQGRVLVSHQEQRKSDIIQNTFHSPTKLQEKTNNNKKIVFSFSNLNNVKSQMEIGTQTEMDQKQDFSNLNLSQVDN